MQNESTIERNKREERAIQVNNRQMRGIGSGIMPRFRLTSFTAQKSTIGTADSADRAMADRIRRAYLLAELDRHRAYALMVKATLKGMELNSTIDAARAFPLVAALFTPSVCRYFRLARRAAARVDAATARMAILAETAKVRGIRLLSVNDRPNTFRSNVSAN